ncbi:MAG: transcription antitermination factor NusB [Alphaproteobacteria bacterium]|nr:transcription antitermination factor NusB [Alphaproteobacteria bacterium]
MQDIRERKTKSGLRGVTRFYAVQVLYQSEMQGKPLDAFIKNASPSIDVILSEDVTISGIDVDFFKTLLDTIKEHLAEIDEIISKNMSDKWKIDRLDKVMKNILRLGTAELLYLKEIPANVVFNEYIEISKAFFEKDDVSFVNGLLNTISKL